MNFSIEILSKCFGQIKPGILLTSNRLHVAYFQRSASPAFPAARAGVPRNLLLAALVLRSKGKVLGKVKTSWCLEKIKDAGKEG